MAVSTIATAHPLHAYSMGLALLAGSFDTNGNADPAKPDGVGFTVKRTGTGTYTVSLSCNGSSIASLTTGAMCNTPGAFRVSAQPYDTTTRSFKLFTVDSSGTLTDVAAHANNRVHFSVALRTVSNTR